MLKLKDENGLRIYDYAVIWKYDGITKKFIFSLRSTTDVSIISKTYWGGGHKNSSDFILLALDSKLLKFIQ